MPRLWQLAFQVAIRRIAVETLCFREDTVALDVLADTTTIPLYVTADEKECVHIFKAERTNLAGEWVELYNLNQRQFLEGTLKVNYPSGEFCAFTKAINGNLVPYAPPAVATQVRAQVAYKPLGDFDEADCGAEYEDAIVAGALAHLLLLPGTDQSVSLAMQKDIEFLSMCSGLRGSSLIGDIGYARASSSKTYPRGFSTQDRLRR
jgi:hypothetical protein